MNLLGRIERLENAMCHTPEGPPEMPIQFVEPVYESGKGMRPRRCTGGFRFLPGGERQWVDADMNPVAGPA